MEPLNLLDQMVEAAVKVLKLAETLAPKPLEDWISKTNPEVAMDFAEFHDEADSLAMDVINMNEWIEKGGFSPFQEHRKEHEEKEMEELEQELKSW